MPGHRPGMTLFLKDDSMYLKPHSIRRSLLRSLSAGSILKIAGAIGLLSISAVPGSARNHVQKDTIASRLSGSRPLVLAHRACWGEAPENSVAAIKACGAVGADAVEIDVRRTKDGQLVLLHDDTVDRTTNGTGVVADMTATQIQALRLRTGDGGSDATLTDQHIPTVKEGLRAAKGRFIVNLHLKAPVEQEVTDLVKRLGMAGQVMTWVNSKPDADQLVHSPMRGTIRLIPTITECGIPDANPCWSRPVESLVDYAPYQPVAFFIDYRNSYAFIREVCAAVRPAGSRVFVETLGPIDQLPRDARRAEWRKLIDTGVSIIMTNHPGDLVDLLRQQGMRHAH